MAKDRLKLVLVSDRASCSPETLEMIKNDIIEVISIYMEIDTQGLDITDYPDRDGRRQRQRTGALCNIPIKEVRFHR